jgi:AraC family transcriptional regulator
MQEQMDLLMEKEQQIPGSVQYSIRRYRKHPQWNTEDLGMLVYHYERKAPKEQYLELRFCISGNVYCQQKSTECDQCKVNARACSDKIDSVDVLSFQFTPVQLRQMVKGFKQDSLGDEILQFKHPSSFSKTMNLCGKMRVVLEALLNNRYTGSMENIFLNAQTQMLLLYSLDCMVSEKSDAVFSCKFLSNETDREKIQKARDILIQQIGEPITIKDLSRRVAMNECYLKKGFKELYSTTIFDFYQSQRMEHAKYLLYEKGLSVTEVSVLLGYSSISHFSTAFKKHTGLKPCELLLRS